jgi:hypothetical protein
MDLLEKAAEWAEMAEESADGEDYVNAFQYKENEVVCLREIISDTDEGSYIEEESRKNNFDIQPDSIIIDYEENNVTVLSTEYPEINDKNNVLMIVQTIKGRQQNVILSFFDEYEIDKIIIELNKIKKQIVKEKE